MINFDEYIEKTQIRKKFLRSLKIECPKCAENFQIQLVDFLHSPAIWECRKCKFKWNFEPENV